MRSPEAYERLRDKVKGPEDLEQEMDRNEKMAEAHLSIESDSEMKEQLKSAVEKSIVEQGAEAIADAPLTLDQKHALESAAFSVAITSHPRTHKDALVIIPEGNVQEKIPVKQSFTEQYLTQLIQN